MRVLIIDHTSALGGAELSLEALVIGMHPESCTFTVALPGQGPLVSRLKEKGVRVELIPLESWRWWNKSLSDSLKYWISIPLQLQSIGRWIQYFRSRTFDLIHININRIMEPLIAAKLLNIPTIMHFRDIPSRILHQFSLGHEAFYSIMNLADHWIANSNATAQDIELHAKRPISVVHNGLDLELFDQMIEKKRARYQNCDIIKIAMIALLVPWKNHLAFIQLAKLVHQTHPSARFFVVGTGNEEYSSSLIREATRERVTNYLEFVGHVSNIPAFLNNMDLLVHPTEQEPFGRVVLEAMAARRPVVALNSGGPAEIVVEGKTGSLVSAGNIEAMAAVVNKLIEVPDLRHEMGVAGRERVMRNFTLEAHCQAIEAVYNQVLSDRIWKQ